MREPEIEEFAELLLQHVRDRSVASCDTLLQPNGNSPPAKRWRNVMAGGSPHQIATTIVPDCVDDTLFHLLHAIDSGALHLLFVAANGNVIDLSDAGLGELAGWYMGGDGWRARFSQQRFVDDCKDLRLKPDQEEQ